MQDKIRGGRKEEKGTYLFTKASKQLVKEEREENSAFLTSFKPKGMT